MRQSRSGRLLKTMLIGLALAACATPVRSDDLTATIDAQIRENARAHGIPAQAVIVMRNGRLIYRGQLGVADLQTRRSVRANDIFPAYSVSKLFASLLVLQLADRGQLSLEDPIGRHLPDLPPAWAGIRVDQLLNHASGLPDFFDSSRPDAPLPETTEDVFRILGDRPLMFEPGTETRYNQTNYVLLLTLLERLHQASYRDIVRARILDPLGLKNTYLGRSSVPADRLVSPYRGEDGRLVRDETPPWRDYSIVHAELYTTAKDLGVLLGAVAEGRLVSRATLIRGWRPYRLANGQSSPFASGWDMGSRGAWRQVGLDGGVKVRVRLLFRGDDLADNIVIVYLTNGTRDNVWTRRLVESVERFILPIG